MQPSNYENTNVIRSLSNNLIAVSESIESLALRQSQVRWFYREPQDKKWTAFNGYDSLRLEAQFRATEALRHKSTLSISWPGDLDEPKSIYNTSINGLHVQPNPFMENISQNLNVTVLGGLFEVNVLSLCCFPIYWTAEKNPMRVLRGIWFRDSSGTLEPLDDDSMVEKLESEYMNWFSSQDSYVGESRGSSKNIESQPTASNRSSTNNLVRSIQTAASAPTLYRVSDATSMSFAGLGGTVLSYTTDTTMTSPSFPDTRRKSPCHTFRFIDCHVDWYGSGEMYLYQDSTSLYIRQKLGMQKLGTRLYRGYNQDAQPNDKPPDVTHLCFVVHGIGQKMSMNNVLERCNDFRDMCNRLKCKYFPGLDAANQRVEFLPVEWRSSLQLDGDTVDSITPTQIRGLRTTLNSSAMDLLYYTSPLYRAEISAGLLSELNRLYRMFCIRNPRFEHRGGKVSILAHSLGCVLIYDLITGWSHPLCNPTDLPTSPPPPPPYSNSVHPRAPDARESQIIPETDVSECKLVPDNTDVTKPDQFSPPPNSYRSSSSSQSLQRVARVSLQLESARTEVNRLEQELSYLAQTCDRSWSTGSAFGDKQTTSNSSIQTSEATNSTAAGSVFECSYFTTNSLLFKSNLENFFCLGSPLPVFLALRGIRPGAYTNQDNILPRRLCPRIFNIYHPADPVAYRLEPLILKHYSSIQPALIHRADAVHKPNYDHIALIALSDQEVKRHCLHECYRTERADTSASGVTSPRKPEQFEPPAAKQPKRRRSSGDSHRSFANWVLGFLSRAVSKPIAVTHTATNGDQVESVPDSETCGEPSTSAQDSATSTTVHIPPNGFADYSSESECNAQPITDNLVTPSLQLQHRIDFQLRASRYESLYVSILTAHTSYWNNDDVGMFVLSQLFESTHTPY